MISLKKFGFCASLFFLGFISFSKEPLPNGYKNISLGMDVDTAKTELQKDSDFGYHGDRDVSLLSGENRILIETDATKGLGSNFLTRCWFQFTNDYLYIITINMNTQKIDYYSVFKTLKEKYGEPESINPSGAYWKNESVTMSLEKPLTLKYIDNEKFESLQNAKTISPSGSEVSQQMFLDKL